MTLLYELSEKKPAGNRPVHREVAIGDAVGDATGWMQLGQDQAIFEIRKVRIDGTRDEKVPGQSDRRDVAKYIKDQDATPMASVMEIQFKQSHESDEQAGVIRTVTGDPFMQIMEVSDLADFVRVRIASIGAGENIFMSCAKRGQQ
jgi:hypothetical protein